MEIEKKNSTFIYFSSLLLILLLGTDYIATESFAATSKISFRDSNDLYIMNPDGTERIKLAADLPGLWNTRWSPDGTKIAFQSWEHPSDPYALFVINSDGSGLTKLSNNVNFSHPPNWSPDGTKIAFTHGKKGNYEIYVVNLDGSGLTNLTNSSGDDVSPD